MVAQQPPFLESLNMAKKHIALLIALVCAVILVVQLTTGGEDSELAESNRTGERIFEAAAKTSGLDVSVLEDIPERLAKACARNKYGLTEGQCVEAIETRKDLCASKTAELFPGKIGTADRMKEVVGSYVACVFQRQ